MISAPPLRPPACPGLRALLALPPFRLSPTTPPCRRRTPPSPPGARPRASPRPHARSPSSTPPCSRCRAARARRCCRRRGDGTPAGSPSGLRDLRQSPVLRLRERPRLDDAHDVADLRLVALVVRVELRRAADDLLVARVRLDRVDLHHDRLVHRARDDDAAALLAAAALVLGLRQARDRLARLRALAPRPRARRTLRAREALALPLRLGRRRRLRSLGRGGPPPDVGRGLRPRERGLLRPARRRGPRPVGSRP